MKRLDRWTHGGAGAGPGWICPGGRRVDHKSKDKTTEKSQKKTTKDPKSAGSATDSSTYTKPDTATDRATLPPDTTDKDKMLKDDKAAPTPAPTR